MNVKPAILTIMTRDQLRRAVVDLGLDEGVDRRSVEKMRSQLSRKGRAGAEILLKYLSEVQVKELCEAVGIDPLGRRAQLVSRIKSKMARSPSDRTKPMARSTPLSTQVYTSRHHGLSVGQFNRTFMEGQLQGCKKLWLASAYYDCAFIEFVLDSFPAGHLQLVVNGLGGLRLRDQVDELGELQSRYSPRLEVKLIFEAPLFHSKVYILQKGSNYTVLIGSANATTAAIDENEEIMVRIDGDTTAFQEYYDNVWASAKNITHASLQNPVVKTRIAFFRTGLLYFKPSATLPKSYAPFREYIAQLPADVRDRLGQREIPHAEPETGLGPFSLDKAINARLESEMLDKRSKASIKPYAVETCLGYWVPYEYRDRFEMKLKQSSKTKRSKIIAFYRQFEGTTDEELNSQFTEYVSAITGVLKSVGEDWQKKWKSSSTRPDDLRSFANFITRTREALKDSHFIDRLCDPLVRVGLPEIWDDPIGARSFESSFFEYIAFALGRPNKHRVVSVIARECGISSARGIQADRIRDAFQERVARGWSSDVWNR